MQVVWSVLKFIGISLLLAFGGFMVFSILREYVFSKLKVNKWIILFLTIAVMIVPAILKIDYNSFWGKYFFPVIYVIMFLWFLEAAGVFKRVENSAMNKGKEKSKEQDIIRPKAKPNRVKNHKKDK